MLDRRRLIRNSTGIMAGAALPDWLSADESFPSSAQESIAGNRKRKKIKVAQIGVGHAHATKLGVYRRSEDFEVVGVSESDSALKKRAQNIATYRDLKWLSAEQIYNRDDIDVVLVETQVRDSLNVAEACIDAGKHIHLDKPAGESFEQFDRILRKAEKKKRIVQMGYMYRYSPAIVLLREMLKNQWLGEVFEIHTVMSKVVPPATRKALAEYPGGIMFELGCHILDLVIGVLGKPDSVSSVNRHSSKHEDQLVDNMLAILEYKNAIATVKSSAQEVEGFARRHFVVCGTKGTFHIQPLDNPSVRLALSEPHGKYKKGYQTVTFPKYQRYVADAADMARIIRGEKENDFPYEHDRIVQKTLLQACELPLS